MNHYHDSTMLSYGLQAMELSQSSTTGALVARQRKLHNSPSMKTSYQRLHAASVVAQLKKDRGHGLGRGPCLKNMSQSPKSLKILQFNINGIATNASSIKLDQVLELAQSLGVQIIALQETKLSSCTSLKIKGYSILRTDRQDRNGGGLVFLIRDVGYESINISADISASSGLEIQGIRITWRGKPLNILNMYHPPDTTGLPNNLQNLLNGNTICIGDLNAKHAVWGCSSGNTRGSVLLNLLDDKGFLLLNDGTPTHSSFSYNTREALDVSFVSPDIFPSCIWSVLNNIGSDHLPILIEFNKRQSVTYSNKKRWNFRRANWKLFSTLADKELEKKHITDSVETDWLNFKKIILKAAGKSIPRGKMKKKRPFLTCKSPMLQPLLEERKALDAELNVSGTNQLRQKLSKVNAEIKIMYAQIKRKKWNDLCTSLDPRSSNGELWRLARSIGEEQPQMEKCNTIKSSDGQIVQNDIEAANLLGLHYQSISRLDFTGEDRQIKRKASNIVHGCRSSTPDKISLFTKAFTMQELSTAISESSLDKSPGPDGIHGQMIRNLGQPGRLRFLDIINDSWNSGKLPREWRRATVIPVRKPTKEASSPESYRPIALTCIACKIMEKMVLKRLNFHLNSHNLLPREQFGFREGHSTTDQVLYFCQRVRDAHNKKPTNHTLAAFLDLSKAFDRVWIQRLIVKLSETFRIGGKALPWIYDFLRNRLIKVSFNNSLSRSFKLYQGVPQGSVLSPTLFMLFLSGIEKTITKRCEVGIFADDVVLWDSGTDLKKLEDNLNFTLVDLTKFAKTHKLSFNPTKSTVSFFTTNRKLYNYHPGVMLDQKPLTVDKHPKYLGFVLDPEITSKKHIDHLVLKSRKRLQILKYISGRDWGADAVTLRNTYISLIRPILEYGYPIYCCASNTNLQKLERVQLSAARIITGLRNSCPNEIVLYEADLQPLSLRRNASLVKYYGKLCSLGDGNRTSAYLRGWRNVQRLKRNSPFSMVTQAQLLESDVEQHHLVQCVDPSEGLPNVYFHTNLLVHVNKQDDLPIYLKQLALEIINNIPADAIKTYTDGSKNEKGGTGSGTYIISNGNFTKIQRRNPDGCSVFRSELIAINESLDYIVTNTAEKEIWILTDSRSSVQHLANWSGVRDKVGVSILNKLGQLSIDRQIHIQWIPSHVDIEGNEIADELAKAGASEVLVPLEPLTYSETYSQAKLSGKTIWSTAPVHHWYRGRRPGGSLVLNCDRQGQTAITRFLSGHLRTMTFSDGLRTFDTCTKCSSEQASPAHILECLGLTHQDLFESPLLVLDFLRVFDFMDLV